MFDYIMMIFYFWENIIFKILKNIIKKCEEKIKY